jgi:hypothetical protein
MSPAAPPPEAALCSCYREQAERYREAVALAESLPALLRAGEHHAERLDRVMRLLAEVAGIEERTRLPKKQWGRAGGRLGDELRAVLTEVTHLIGRLAQSLAAAEQEASARQAELVPQVDGVIRARAMRRAYKIA